MTDTKKKTYIFTGTHTTIFEKKNYSFKNFIIMSDNYLDLKVNVTVPLNHNHL